MTAEVEVIGLPDDKPVATLRTTVTDQDGRIVLDGRAVTWREPLGRHSSLTAGVTRWRRAPTVR